MYKLNKTLYIDVKSKHFSSLYYLRCVLWNVVINSEVFFRNVSSYEFVSIRRKITAIFPTSQVKRAVVLVVLTLEPVTQKGRSASTLVTSRLALFFGVKENRLPIFGSVIGYTDTHSFMVSVLMRNVAVLTMILPTSYASLRQHFFGKCYQLSQTHFSFCCWIWTRFRQWLPRILVPTRRFCFEYFGSSL